MKAAHVFEQFPCTQPVFKQFGFGQLFNPILRNTLGRITTLERACRLHNVNLNDFLTALNQSLYKENNVIGASSAADQPLTQNDIALLNEVLRSNVASLAAQYPQTRPVLEKYFGQDCFLNAATTLEKVERVCAVHDTDPVEFARDCLSVINQRREKAS